MSSCCPPAAFAGQDGNSAAALGDDVPTGQWDGTALAVLPDERLLVLAREGSDLAARNKLILRHYQLAKRLISRWAERYGLSGAETEDAHQEAVFWILEALEDFTTDQTDESYKCRFRSFLSHVLGMRLIDYVRHCWRMKRHFDCSPEAQALVNGNDWVLDSPTSGRSLRATLGEEPCERAQHDELTHQVWRIVSRLGPRCRELWELTISRGFPLRDAASQLGISYDAAKRSRRKLVAALRRELDSRWYEPVKN
jgi:RNA polymerase sigma factor (sigma-70 family)